MSLPAEYVAEAIGSSAAVAVSIRAINPTSNDVITGPGGSQLVSADPSGIPIELCQPAVFGAGGVTAGAVGT